jgi:hypothetical protein
MSSGWGSQDSYGSAMLWARESNSIAGPQVLLGVRAGVSDVVGLGERGLAVESFRIVEC